MEQNQNPFATAEAAWPTPPTPSTGLPSVPDPAGGEPATVLDFDPVVLRARCDGWTPARQRAFIEELADCGVIREAAARVGMTEQSAMRIRRRADAGAFNLAWEAALHIGTDRLRSVAIERAVEGVVKKKYYHGEVVGEERVYDNKLLTWLLGRAKPTIGQFDVDQVVRQWDRWMEAIEDGLDKPMAAPDETSRAPVWQSDEDVLWTSFPPPPGFNGHQEGKYGDPDYRRECTLDETAAFHAAREREWGEQSRRRDLYFDSEKMKIRPLQA